MRDGDAAAELHGALVFEAEEVGVMVGGYGGGFRGGYGGGFMGGCGGGFRGCGGVSLGAVVVVGLEAVGGGWWRLWRRWVVVGLRRNRNWKVVMG